MEKPMSKVLAAIEALAHNVTHPKFVSEALAELDAGLADVKARLEGLGHEATGETGEAVTALGSRLDSLTTAVSGVGELVTALTARVAALEAKASAPAAPVAPAPAPAPAVPGATTA
jgi:hypothetical protein